MGDNAGTAALHGIHTLKQRVSNHLKTNSHFKKYIDTNSSTLYKIYYFWLLIFGGILSKCHLKYWEKIIKERGKIGMREVGKTFWCQILACCEPFIKLSKRRQKGGQRFFSTQTTIN